LRAAEGALESRISQLISTLQRSARAQATSLQTHSEQRYEYWAEMASVPANDQAEAWAWLVTLCQTLPRVLAQAASNFPPNHRHHHPQYHELLAAVLHHWARHALALLLACLTAREKPRHPQGQETATLLVAAFALLRACYERWHGSYSSVVRARHQLPKLAKHLHAE
jgi:hypothetical protein